MHPIERLRYVARSRGDDQRALVDETAAALRGLGLDHAGLVVACRRVVERHPSAGALWWLCAHVLTSADPLRTASQRAAELQADDTGDVLANTLPEDATVAVAGWPDLAGEALFRRGDVRTLVVDGGDHAQGFVRAMQRAGNNSELVPASGSAAAAAAADVVIVEAHAASSTALLATVGSRAMASVAYCAEVPVWGVVGRGRCLPETQYAASVVRSAGRSASWLCDLEEVSSALFALAIADSSVIDPAGLRASGPEAPELLRISAM